MLIILLLCISGSALKLLEDPEFEVAGALYDAECGDRYNFKCWRKGGHSLEKEEAAYVSALAWKSLVAPDETAGWLNVQHEVTMTWNKKVDVVGGATITGQECDTAKENCVTPSKLEMVTAETGVGGAKTMDFSKSGDADMAGGGAVITNDYWYRVAAQSIVVSSSQSIKNAGKKKNVNLAFTQSTTQVQATNIESAASIDAIAWDADNTLPWESGAPAPIDDDNFTPSVSVTWSKKVVVDITNGSPRLTMTNSNGGSPSTFTCTAGQTTSAGATVVIFSNCPQTVGNTAAGDTFAVLEQSIDLNSGSIINHGNWNGQASTMEASRALPALSATAAMVPAYTANTCPEDRKLTSLSSCLDEPGSIADLAACFVLCKAAGCKYFAYSPTATICQHDSTNPPGSTTCSDTAITDASDSTDTGYTVYVRHGETDLSCD